jgi:hypothetical protein
MNIQSLILKIDFRGKVCDLESPSCLPQMIQTDRNVYRPKKIVSWMNNSLAIQTVNDETWKCRDVESTHSLKSLYYMFARLYNVHTPNMWRYNQVQKPDVQYCSSKNQRPSTMTVSGEINHFGLNSTIWMCQSPFASSAIWRRQNLMSVEALHDVAPVFTKSVYNFLHSYKG